MNAHQNTITLLNDLIIVNKQRINDYQKAIDNSVPRNGDSIIVYSKLIDQGLKFVNELKNNIYLLGGQIEYRPDANHTVYNVWSTLRDEFQSQQIINIEHCEYYREAALKTYEQALAADYPERDIKEMLKQHHSLLKSACTEVRDFSEIKKAVY